MDCFGTYFTHDQTCDNVRVKSATQWTASVHTLHMTKPVITFVFKSATQSTAAVHTLHMPKPVITFVLRVLYAMDCFRTYFTHVAICDNVPVGRMIE